MRDLKEVYLDMQQKKREKSELGKMMRDALLQNAEHKEIVEQMRVLREKKKSIENVVRSECLSDASQLDILKLEIGAGNEMLSDIAITMYANHETVEIVDEEHGTRLTPVFSVKFRKENLEPEAAKAAEARAASHPERTYAPA